ncbi:alpha/beta hydrolase [Pantoea sp. A4]|uniref:alpha/beta hydrolase n=1 Tax=Pantoea sp. A4 TaxID=1225184 RepID=UPI00037FCC0E|nr:alpha/beta hydrolase [Pantoea sp. A4]
MSYLYDADLLDAIPSFGVFDLHNPAETRRKLIEIGKTRPAPDASGVIVEDFYIPGSESGQQIKVRSYRAEQHRDATLPVILNIHGGGFVIGRIEVDDATCIDLARKLPVNLISVEYRLAPEHPYPAPLEDCYSALVWVSEQHQTLKIDNRRIIVHGVSAGGGLAAALTLLSRDRGGPGIYYQYLDLPELDDRLNSVSMQKFHDVPGWNTPNAALSWRHYLGELYGSQEIPEYAAPSRAQNLQGLPPAYIGVFEYDPLRSEAVNYAEKLFAADVPTELHVYAGAYHLAYLIPHAQISQRRNADRVTILKRVLNIS